MLRWLTPLGLVVALAFGCGGDGGDTDPGPVGTDEGPGETVGPTDDGTLDPGPGNDQGTPDPGKDAPKPTDPGPDAGFPSGCSLSADDHAGLEYGCTDLCAKIATCPGASADCAMQCQLLRREGKVTFLNDLGRCITDSACAVVPEGQNLASWCQQGVTANLVAGGVSEARRTVCTTFRATAGACGFLGQAGATEALEASCLGAAAMLRDEAWGRVAACKETACDSLKECVAGAVCFDTLAIDETLPVGDPAPDAPDVPDVPQFTDPGSGQDLFEPDVPVVCKTYGAQAGFTFTCAQLCAVSKACEPTLDTAVCEANCAEIRTVMSVDLLNDLYDCAAAKECSAVAADADGKKRVIMGCYGQILFPSITSDQQKTCGDLGAALDAACPGGHDNFVQSCVQILAGYRAEVKSTYLGCQLSDGCAQYMACVNGAGCFAGPPEP